MKVIRAILFIINIILALGLFLTTLAGNVLPSSFLLPSLLAFGYLPLLIANIAMVIVWLLMRRWTALLSILVIALRWSFLTSYFHIGLDAKTPDSDTHPQMVSLMTFNVHQFHGRSNQLSTNDTIALHFIELIHKTSPDILCLQEVAMTKKVNIVDSLEVMGYNHYYGAQMSSKGIPYGTVVFSRLPITYVTKLDKEKILVEVMKEHDKLRVCCVHMDSYQFNDSDRKEIDRARHGEVQESIRPTLHKVKETILSHEKEWTDCISSVVAGSSVPLVLAGDFNDIPSSWLYRHISEVMTDCFKEKGNGLSITYNGGFPQFRIDMVFHSKELQTLRYRRIRTDISDHYPVMVTLNHAK